MNTIIDCEPYIGINNLYYYMYKIINLQNNNYYIGVHTAEKLPDKYNGSGKLLRQAYKKYGIKNFEKHIISFYDNEALMYDAEFNTVNDLLVLDKNCYNICHGGKGGRYNTIIVMDNTGKKFTVSKEDERYKSGELIPINKIITTTGKQHSEETKQKMRLSRLAYLKEHPIIKGTRHLSEETKQKIGNNSKLYTKVFKNNISKSIKKIELEQYLNDGWIHGNLLGYTDMVLIHKDKNEKTVQRDELYNYLIDGWITGKYVEKDKNIRRKNVSNTLKEYYKYHDKIIDEDTRIKISNTFKEKGISTGKNNPMYNRIWLTKDGKNKACKPEDLQKFLSDGWIKGFIKKVDNKKRIWINNNIIEKCIDINEKTLYNNWNLGRLKNKNIIA